MDLNIDMCMYLFLTWL